MIEAKKKQRRWPWLVLGVVGILVGGQIAWLLRPLNATESRLVGYWIHAQTGSNFNYRFHSDRRFESEELRPTRAPATFDFFLRDASQGWKWSASRDRIHMILRPVARDRDPLTTRVLTIARKLIGTHRSSVSLRIVDTDHIVIDGEEFVRSTEPLGFDTD